MSPTYLDVPFKEKDQAKALGARWDVTAKRWYAPEGRDLDTFNAWLPSDPKKDTFSEPASFELQPTTVSSNQALALQKNGITLSRLLFGVSHTALGVCLTVYLVALWRSLPRRSAVSGG